MRKAHFTDILIAGGGASGLFCAQELARLGKKAILLESGPDCGRKLSISGGGRANFSNRHMDASHYLCHPEANFCAAALKSFPVSSLLERLKAWKLMWEERTQGRLFLRMPASRLVSRLMQNCGMIFTEQKILSVRRVEEIFHIQTSKGLWQAKRLVLALGSPARPGLGATNIGYKIAASLGHSINKPRPVLTPLLYATGGQPELRELAGISVKVKICLDKEIEDDLLFTHQGLSGPAILNASIYWREGTVLNINFLPDRNFEKMLDEAPRSTPARILRGHLAPRLADALLPPALAHRKNAELSRGQRRVLAGLVHSHLFSGLSRSGLEKAEVCSGGVAVDEIEPSTMSSRIVPNLYLTGEMLDVTGELGGYNLHWAFASAFCAAHDM